MALLIVWLPGFVTMALGSVNYGKNQKFRLESPPSRLRGTTSPTGREGTLSWRLMSSIVLLISVALLTFQSMSSFADSLLGPPIPFKLIGGHIVVPIRINGQGPFQAELDDGSQRNFLDAKIANKIGLQSNGYARISSFGPSDVIMQTSNQAGISFDGCLLNGQSIVVADFQKTGMDGGASGATQAVIGIDLFQNYAVTIDSLHSTISLSDPQTYVAPDNAVVVPVSIGTTGIPLAAATINGVPGVFQVDLGANGCVLLYPGFVAQNQEHFSTAGAIVQTYKEIGGYSTMMMLPSGCDLTLGPLTAHGSPLNILSADPPHFGSIDLAGNLGYAIWRHSVVTFDLVNHRIIVDL